MKDAQNTTVLIAFSEKLTQRLARLNRYSSENRALAQESEKKDSTKDGSYALLACAVRIASHSSDLCPDAALLPRGAQGVPGSGVPLPPEATDMRNSCPLHMPVSVTDYVRIRHGKVEYVRTHCRSLPRSRRV